jgi:hypothetical protein
VRWAIFWACQLLSRSYLARLIRPWRWRRCSSETSVDFRRTTRRYIPKNSTLQDKKFDQKWQWTCMQIQQSSRTAYVELHMKLTNSIMLRHFMVLRNIFSCMKFYEISCVTRVLIWIGSQRQHLWLNTLLLWLLTFSWLGPLNLQIHTVFAGQKPQIPLFCQEMSGEVSFFLLTIRYKQHTKSRTF